MSANELKPTERQERTENFEGFALHVVSYRLGSEFHAVADNTDPGAVVARATAPTREAAEASVLEDAQRRLGRMRIFPTT